MNKHTHMVATIFPHGKKKVGDPSTAATLPASSLPPYPMPSCLSIAFSDASYCFHADPGEHLSLSLFGLSSLSHKGGRR